MNTLGEAYESSGVLEVPSMKVFIQNEAGSFAKNIYDEETLTFTGTARVSRAYPLPYGFILNTTGDDGLNVDCFVLTKTSLHTGKIVECDAVGLMEQIEDGKEDHKVLAVIRGEEERLDNKTKQELIEFVSHVFDHVAGKTVLAGNFRAQRICHRLHQAAQRSRPHGRRSNGVNEFSSSNKSGAKHLLLHSKLVRRAGLRATTK